MIHQLKRIFDWLDTRFPAKFHVTDAIFHDFQRQNTSHKIEIDTLRGMVLNMQSEIVALKTSISAIKDIIAKSGASVIKSQSELLRDRFVRGELPRDAEQARIDQAIRASMG